MEQQSEFAVTARSLRTVDDACAIAGIEYDVLRLSAARLGVLFLDLLVRGIDHKYVGTLGWQGAILSTAPKERSRAK